MKKFLLKLSQLFYWVVFGAYVVFICNMAISYYHAHNLFSHIGDFPGIFAHIAVIAFDTVFALCVLVISTGIMRGIKIGWPVWMAGMFGLGITTWSNVRASMKEEWIYLVTGQFNKISAIGWESFVAGLSTPTALVAIELLLAWMVANRALFESKSTENKSTTKPEPLATPIQMEIENELTTVPLKPRPQPDIEYVKRVAMAIKEKEGKVPDRLRLHKETGFVV